MAENMTPTPFNDGPKPGFYTAFGSNGAALPQYAAYSEHAVIAEVLAVARNQGFNGTGEERMRDLGWSVKPVFDHATIESLDRELRSWQITAEKKDNEIAQLKGELEAVGAGGVQPLRATVPPFSHVSQYKLDQLLEQGYVITGYAIEEPIEGAQPSRGFINSGGFVGWWSDNMQTTPAAPAAVLIDALTAVGMDAVGVGAGENVITDATRKKVEDALALAGVQGFVHPDALSTQPAAVAVGEREAWRSAWLAHIAPMDKKHDTSNNNNFFAAGFRAALATTPEVGPTSYQVQAITTAYEQGVGKGHDAYSRRVEINNPYGNGYRCDEAWMLGYKEGKLQADRKAKAEVQPNPWQQAVDAELVSAHLGIAGNVSFADAAKALSELIQWNIDVATNPQTNGGLSLQPVSEVQAEPVAWRIPVFDHEGGFIDHLLVKYKTSESCEPLHTSPQATQQDAIDAALIALLPGTYYMDQPDGGSVTPIEQVQRMAQDAGRYRALRTPLDARGIDYMNCDSEDHPVYATCYHQAGYYSPCPIDGAELDAKADAAIQAAQQGV